MRRRRPFTLPHGEHADALRALIIGTAPIAPADPAGFASAVVAHRLAGPAVAAIDSQRLVVPAETARELRDAHAVGVLASAIVRRELPAAAEALRTATGAPPVVLKGPAIADRFYDDRVLRPFADLDLLVDAGRLQAAVGALSELGYHERVELRPGFGATHGHDVHMSKPVGRREVTVEVHWRIGDDPVAAELSAEKLRPAAEPAPDAPDALYAAPVDQLLICAVHLLSDRLKRLAWMVDIVRICERLGDAEWDGAFERADRLGLAWVLHRALDYPRHHLGFERARPLPAGPAPPFGPMRAVEEIDARASLHLGRLAQMRWRERRRYLRDVLVPAREGIHVPPEHAGDGDLRRLARHLSGAIRSLLPGR